MLNVGRTVLYGQNLFVAGCRERDGRVLQKLGKNLRIVRRLRISLHGQVSTWDSIPAEPSRALERIAAAIQEHVRPHTLSLDLVAPMGSPGVIKYLIESLRLLPPLKHVVLDVRPQRVRGQAMLGLGVLLRQCCDQLQSQSVKAPFPFQKLPNEIQLMVLQCSDLVVPEQERALDLTRWTRAYFGKPCCRRCRDALKVFSRSSPFCACDGRKVCTSSCICRVSASPLFAVSSGLRARAGEVFYSQNHFRLFSDATGIATELNGLNRKIQYIRHLTIFVDNYWRSVPSTDDIEQVLQFLAEKGCPEAMQLKLRYREVHGFPVGEQFLLEGNQRIGRMLGKLESASAVARRFKHVEIWLRDAFINYEEQLAVNMKAGKMTNVRRELL